MFLAYLDLIGGLAGDMFVAALADAGVPQGEFEAVAQKLPGQITLSFSERRVQGFRAKVLDLRAQEPGSLPSSFAPLMELISRLEFPREVVLKVQEILKLLFEAEAKVHGLPLERVHLHELSAYDTLFDLFAVVSGLRWLQIERLLASPIPLARGEGKGAHGFLPYPAPATLEILKGLPITSFPEAGESVTPTGAALLKGLGFSFDPWPPFTLLETGLGAGQRDWKSRPNIVRLLWGEIQEEGWGEEEILELSTDIDDESPEFIAGLAERLREAGALDVHLWPVYMKKGRLGTRLNILAPKGKEALLIRLVFTHSTTLGVRIRQVRRALRPRYTEVVETPVGKVRVKVSKHPSLSFKAEWEDLKRISYAKGIPLNRVRQIVYEALFKRYSPFEDDRQE